MQCQRIAEMLACAVRMSRKPWKLNALLPSSLRSARSGTHVACVVVVVPERPIDKAGVGTTLWPLARAASNVTDHATAAEGPRPTPCHDQLRIRSSPVAPARAVARC